MGNNGFIITHYRPDQLEDGGKAGCKHIALHKCANLSLPAESLLVKQNWIAAISSQRRRRPTPSPLPMIASPGLCPHQRNDMPAVIMPRLGPATVPA